MESFDLYIEGDTYIYNNIYAVNFGMIMKYWCGNWESELAKVQKSILRNFILYLPLWTKRSSDNNSGQVATFREFFGPNGDFNDLTSGG
jgi:hypothetical protein